MRANHRKCSANLMLCSLGDSHAVPVPQLKTEAQNRHIDERNRPPTDESFPADHIAQTNKSNSFKRIRDFHNPETFQLRQFYKNSAIPGQTGSKSQVHSPEACKHLNGPQGGITQQNDGQGRFSRSCPPLFVRIK